MTSFSSVKRYLHNTASIETGPVMHECPRISQIILRNSYYKAVFHDNCELLQLHQYGQPYALIKRVAFAYKAKKGVGEAVNAYAGASFEMKEFAHDDQSVRCVMVSEHLKLTCVYRCIEDHPLLQIDIKIEARHAAADLREIRLPRITLADDFASVVEGDEHDLYFDGAEVGDGFELPCWRVFFQEDHRTGLLLATRSKAMMSHIQIWPRTEKCIECRPHLMCSYNTDYTAHDAPLTLKPNQCLEMSLEIGPWQQAAHQELLAASRLLEPRQVATSPEPSHRPAVKLPGHVFSAVSIAPAAAIGSGDRRDCWMVTSQADTRFAEALFANSGYRPPMLVFNPQLQGLHRIFVGVGSGYRACMKLSGEEHTRSRMLPDSIANQTPWPRQLQGVINNPSELDFGVTDMTGQHIELGMSNSSQGHGMLDYVRFVPLDSAESQAYLKMQTSNHVLPLVGFADAYDIGYRWGDAVTADTQPYEDNIAAHASAGFKRVFWRIDGECSDFPTKEGTLRPISCWAHQAYEPQAKAYSLMLQKHDLLAAAVNAGRKHGVSIWGWMRFNSYFVGVRSTFYRQHPEYRDHGEAGNVLDFRLNLARPEVRRHKIAILLDAARYGIEGLNLGFLRHPPVIFYPPELVDSYRKKYGTEPPRDMTIDYFQHQNTLPEATDEYLRWYRHRAQIMTIFGRELCAALKSEGMDHVKISIWVRPKHCLFDGIDLDAWLGEGLCDEVVAGPYPGDPELLVADDAWRKRVQDHVPLIGGIMPVGMGDHSSQAQILSTIERYKQQGYDGLCTYESNDAVNMPRMLDLYDQLRQ